MDFSQSYLSKCVCVSSFGSLSDHRECDKWMCQSLMEHYDCSAGHKLYRDGCAGESCLNQPYIIYETKKDVWSVDRQPNSCSKGCLECGTHFLQTNMFTNNVIVADQLIR